MQVLVTHPFQPTHCACCTPRDARSQRAPFRGRLLRVKPSVGIRLVMLWRDPGQGGGRANAARGKVLGLWSVQRASRRNDRTSSCALDSWMVQEWAETDRVLSFYCCLFLTFPTFESRLLKRFVPPSLIWKKKCSLLPALSAGQSLKITWRAKKHLGTVVFL